MRRAESRATSADVRIAPFTFHGEALAAISIPALPTSILDKGLSRTEQEILVAILQGASNAEIAAKRCTSLRTIANQLASIYRKLAVSSRSELAALYRTD